MKQVFNPYLPLIEYVPDGEPHVFGNRVYIYGSHDRAGGEVYCEQHYQVWSAPVNDLKDWRNEGVSYLRTQDPSNKDDSLQLWAPDVTKGPDGRYYMYYCFSFYPEVGVAVSDNLAGPFTFYGHVHYPEHILGGKILQEGMDFLRHLPSEKFVENIISYIQVTKVMSFVMLSVINRMKALFMEEQSFQMEM